MFFGHMSILQIVFLWEEGFHQTLGFFTYLDLIEPEPQLHKALIKEYTLLEKPKH